MAAPMKRSEAVRAIREKILSLVDEEHSMCQVAAERGIYCHGFKQDTEEQLRRRYDWLVKKNPAMSREELEEMANRWQLARQVVDGVPTSCDAQALEHDTCMGWDGFDDETLSRYYAELVGGEIEVVEG
jgi:hypothetical protein